MSLNTQLQDPQNGISASIEDREGKNRLHVLTEPSKRYIRRGVFFTNSNFGSNLNIDASLTTDNLYIYDGGDNAYWTPEIISGNWDFQSTDYAYSGTYSVDATKTKNNDTAQFYNDTKIDVTYSSLIGYIYITSWEPDDEVEIYGFDELGDDVVIGQRVNIGDYVNTDNTNIWQEFVIPTTNMNMFDKQIDAIRITTVNSSGNAPNYYLDEIHFQGGAGGGPYTYTVAPRIGTWLHVYGFGYTIVNTYDSTMADGTLPNIPPNSILGRSMINGFLYQRKENGAVQFSYTFKKLVDILAQPASEIVSSGYDGTYSWIKIEVRFDNAPLMLKYETEDNLSITISEDLSTFEFFKISADCKEEDRQV